MAVWQPLIVCGISDPTKEEAAKGFNHMCGFSDLIVLASNVITDLIVLSTLVALVVCLVAGFRLLTSGGDQKALAQAKHALISVVKGYVVIFAAWLIVYNILHIFVAPGYSLLAQP
jgi:hypothetical protein